MKRTILLFAVLGLLTGSCGKDEEETLVEGNVAPPDSTIEDVVYNNYVNKLYISLLGRKATEVEESSAISTLQAAGLSSGSRSTLIKEIHAKQEYYDNEFNIIRSNYLNDADSADFAEAKWILEFAKTLTTNPVEIAFYDAQLSRLEPLLTIESDLKSGAVSMVEAHKVIVNNYIYDQINMGSENYVVSLFQNFLLRYPTTAELEAGKDMFEGKPNILFGISGKNLDELIELFFADLGYFEGQVRQNYLRFLYREPTNDEIALLTSAYMINNDYEAMQAYILGLDEYVGI